MLARQLPVLDITHALLIQCFGHVNAHADAAGGFLLRIVNRYTPASNRRTLGGRSESAPWRSHRCYCHRTTSEVRDHGTAETGQALAET